MSEPGEGGQATLKRLRRFGVRPDHELGQNFLIDSNILGVIGRAADLEAADVVLEIGGGLGVLSEYLAERTAHVHVVEVDERLKPALLDATAAHANVTLHWSDAMALDLGALDPAPTKLVANLPYGIAASVLLRALEELPALELALGMVQREVGERLAASPGGRLYGLPSVLAQLSSEVAVVRRIPRTVFTPVPNVDSVLVRMRRRDASPDASGTRCRDVRELAAAAFAHRRKTVAGSLAIAGRDRARVRTALEQMGHPPDARAERLAPEDFVALAGLLRS
jgi:16S rRNA (adenine1518-N6/adenine1519-N6)-dimethyltransferase